MGDTEVLPQSSDSLYSTPLPLYTPGIEGPEEHSTIVQSSLSISLAASNMSGG